MTTTLDAAAQPRKRVRPLEGATVRFCGDSGDGMQLAGTQLTNTSALAGNDVATFPDFPAEIRAPAGTLAGVSGFQLHFASRDIFTPGDKVDALIAMNAAALKTNLRDLKRGGILLVNSDAMNKKGLDQAGYAANPIEDGSLESYQTHAIEMTTMTRNAVEGLGLSQKEADRCRNFFAMGLAFWMYGRSLEPTLRFIDRKFGGKPAIAEANRRALKAGFNFGNTTEAFASSYEIEPADLPPGKYRNMTGNQALAWGLVTAARLSGKELFLGSYPITPASDILHELSRLKHFGVRTFQAEDEIAAVSAAIGAAYGGAMAITTTSGPGMALKAEAMGLAVMLELPLVIINVQRGGPSTGLPTKTEQADLNQALFGRNGECPLPVLAARSPADCFDVAQDAWRVATRYMTPVVILSDGYIGNGAEPWRIPEAGSLAPIEISHPRGIAPAAPDGASGNGPGGNGSPASEKPFRPYQRDENLARRWALPGAPGLMHRVGGLEKEDRTGAVSYDPLNHEHMTRQREAKVAGVVKSIPPIHVEGPAEGDVLLVSWGGVYGACATAADELRRRGEAVSHVSLRYLNPLPSDLGDILSRFRRVLVPELNRGQLRRLLRSEYLIDAQGLSKVQGKPFTVGEIVERVSNLMKAEG